MAGHHQVRAQALLTSAGKYIPLLLFFIAGGCSPVASVSPTSTNSSSQSKSSPKLSVTQSADYSKAKTLFVHGDYTGANVALSRLLTDPKQTTADRAFLQRQITICNDATAGKTIEKSGKVASPAPVQNAGSVSTNTVDCGPRALLLLCREFKPPVSASLPALCKTAGVKAPRGASLEGMTKAAKSVGFLPEAVQMDRDALANLSTSAIAWVDGNHYLAVYRVNRSLQGIDYDTVTIQDPNKNTKEDILLTKLLSRSGGVLMTLTPPRTTATAQR
jgi:hypothetical protein